MTDRTPPADPRVSQRNVHDEPTRRPWVRPALELLPPLTSLTLQSGGPIPGGGDTGSGGSTVFS